MEVSPLIQLLVSPETVSDDHVASVCEELKERFGLTRVLVRSLQAVSWEALGSSSAVSLIVILSDNVSSIEWLQDQSVSPIVAMRTGKSAAVLALQIAKFCAVGSSSSTGADLKAKIQMAVLLHRQVQSVQDAQYKTKSPFYSLKIQARLAVTMTGDAVAVEGRQRGKVRDRYARGNQVALVTTDRQSGFDRQLAQIPFKGAVLNLTSAFWFAQTKDIIKNHVVAVPHPYVTVGRKCQPFPIEFVVRSYMTGSTGTSIWKNYQDGVRNYCGHLLPDGMHKNQKLEANLLTPTTKEEAHDRPISLADILTEKWMTAQDLDVCAKAALEVFALGQKIASQRGLILVDTKYEFGRDEETGEILLIDEVHTPDSSRYWLASSYEERIAAGQEPENIDKEFLRLWFRERCDPYKDAVIPDAPPDLVAELSRRYILLYELITGESFDFDAVTDEAAITKAVNAHL
jgi:phosphoribosylaminoimidazole-succinocarboxamide synthase